MSLPQADQECTRKAPKRTLPQASPDLSHGQQARSVEALRTRTSPEAVTAASTALTKRKRDPRPKLDNEKCARCRKDKVKCSPQPRVWPDKCERCSSKGFECSPGEVKRRARGKASLNQESAELRWDHADLTNLVIFVQLLKHEMSLLDEASSYFEKLNLDVDIDVFTPYESRRLYKLIPELVEDVKSVLRYVLRLESLTMTDRILYENAHETIGEDFVVSRINSIPEESLAELPIGIRVRHLIRKLRFDIQRRGSCDFGPLYGLVSQLGQQWPGWAARFDCFAQYDWHRSVLHKGAAYSLVVSQEFPTEPLIHIWVRDYILRSENEIPSFPVGRFVELWNSDSESVDLFNWAGAVAGDSTKLPLLLVATLSNKPRIVRALLKNSLNTQSQPTLDGFRSFHLAALIGSVDCYRELLRCENGKAMEGERTYDDDLPLHVAAKNGHKQMVDYILGVHSDDGSYVNERDCLLRTPLMQAAESGKHDVVQFLLNYPGVNIAAVDKDGKTALVYAIRHQDIFRLILSKLPDRYFNAVDDDGNTPLHWLAKYAGENAMQTVLSVPSVLPDKIGEGGRTPLCNAVHSGNLGAVKVLGIRRDVDVTKLSTCEPGYKSNYIDDAKYRADKNNSYSQVLDWLKIHCKELEAELVDWEIRNQNVAPGYQRLRTEY